MEFMLLGLGILALGSCGWKGPKGVVVQHFWFQSLEHLLVSHCLWLVKLGKKQRRIG